MESAWRPAFVVKSSPPSGPSLAISVGSEKMFNLSQRVSRRWYCFSACQMVATPITDAPKVSRSWVDDRLVPVLPKVEKNYSSTNSIDWNTITDQSNAISRITDTGDHMITSIPVPRSQILGRLILPKSTSTSTFDSNDLSGDLCTRKRTKHRVYEGWKVYILFL